jgi:outer membrane protein TolC
MMFFLVSVAAAESVSLDTAVRSALAHRPFLQQAQAEALAATAAASAASGRFLPQISLQEHYVRSNEPGTSLFIALNQERLVLSPTADPYNHPPVRQDFETRLQLQQTVFDSNLIYTTQAARRQAEAARSKASWSREESAFAVFQAYLGVQWAQGACAWAQSSLSEADEILRLAELRQQSGVGLKSDVLRARVQQAEAQRRHLRSTNDQILARRRLALTMGLEQSEIEIDGPLDPEQFIDEVISPAPRADLDALRLQSDAARAKQSAGTAAIWLPRVGVGASYSSHDSDQPLGFDSTSWMVHGALTWDLFSGLSQYHVAQGATYQAQAAEQALREATRSVELQRQEAQLRAEEAQLQYETSLRAMAAAEESHNLLRERFASGLTDLSDLLGMQAALDRARADRVEAEVGLVLARGQKLFQNGRFLNKVLADEVSQ